MSTGDSATEAACPGIAVTPAAVDAPPHSTWAPSITAAAPIAAIEAIPNRSTNARPASVPAPLPDSATGLVSRRLIVADAGQSWLDKLFDQARREAHQEVVSIQGPRKESFDRWLDYKQRSVALGPGSWLAFFQDGSPVGLAQGASVARVFHTHFLYLAPCYRKKETVQQALNRIQELAARQRCHTLSCEGPNTGALIRTLGPGHLVEFGFTWHERLQFGLLLADRESRPVHRGNASNSFRVVPLSLAREDVARLLHLESEAFRYAACDHPGELPTDFSDGYRTTLIPMQATSAMGMDLSGVIRGAVYGELKGETVWIHTVFVEPGWRNKGLASILLDHCLDRYTRAGHTSVELNVLAANLPAVRIYQNAGFRELKRIDLFIKKL